MVVAYNPLPFLLGAAVGVGVVIAYNNSRGSILTQAYRNAMSVLTDAYSQMSTENDELRRKLESVPVASA